MQKILVTTAILLALTIADDFHEFKLAELNKKQMFAQNYDDCVAQSDGNCCFKGMVTLTIDYDDSKINSFQITGNHVKVGKNCGGVLTFYPKPEQSTQKTIVQQKFLIGTKDANTLFSTFFTSYLENSDKSWSAIFSVSQEAEKATWISQNFLLKSSGDYSELVKETDNSNNSNNNNNSNTNQSNNNKNESSAKQSDEDTQKTSCSNLKYNMILLAFSYVLLHFTI